MVIFRIGCKTGLEPRNYPQKTQLALVGHEPSLSNWAEILLWGEAKEQPQS